MAGETTITIIGNLTTDPELRFTPNGAPVANFTVASTPRQFDRQANEWRDGETLFMRCSLWREAAENATESLAKGMRVIVEGRLVARSWDDKDTGQKRTVMEMQVDEVGPSLRYATAKVNRTSRGGGGGFGGGGQQGGYGGGGQQGGRAAEADPWSTAGAGAAGGAQGAPASGGGNRGGGWGSGPSHDEPPF